jgi:signal transduction histidine kinase
MLNIAVNNLDRVVRLTSNILDLEGLSSGAIVIQKQPCDLHSLLNTAIEQSLPAAQQHSVHLLISPHCRLSMPILLDSQRIAQVLNHLILNAVQSSQAGSSVWLEAEIQTTQTSRQDLSSDHLLISVKDQGQGIPADKLETIFGPFQQVDTSDTRRQGGAGLGLALCRSIVQQHQGRLWVESSLGQGSTFYLALPIQRVAVQA